MYVSWNHNSSEDPVMAYRSNPIQTKIHYRIAEWHGTKMANRIIEEPRNRRNVGISGMVSVACMYLTAVPVTRGRHSIMKERNPGCIVELIGNQG